MEIWTKSATLDSAFLFFVYDPWGAFLRQIRVNIDQ